MAQPNSGYQWTQISGTIAGTTVITDRQATLSGVYFPYNTTGTVTLYDSPTGTASKSIELRNTVGSIPTTLDLNLNFSNGITAITGGTTTMVAIWN